MPTVMIPYLPLVPYAAVALGLVPILTLFWSLKRELQMAIRRERRRVDQMFERLEEAAQTTPLMLAPPVFIPVAARPGFNIDRRIHAVRLLRKGEDAGYVAAALGIPRSEVDLLVRVQGMVAHAPSKAMAKTAAK
ncbi:MAG: hypothetical protein ABI811_06975 [Acidobacteriota bacterium]